MAGYDPVDWRRQIEIKQQNVPAYMSLGLHPWQVISMTSEQIHRSMEELERLLPQADACGETGMDAHKTEDPQKMKIQEDVFLRHLEMNRSLQKPLVLHVVKSHGRVLEILKENAGYGIVHGFSGSWDVARAYTKLGYKISLGRGLVHKGYKQLKETAAQIDLEDFVLESDATFEDGVGEDASEIFLKVAETFAQMRSLPIDKVLEHNFKNIKKIFK